MRHWRIAFGIVLAAISSATAQETDYPNAPVTVIAATSAGSSTDQLARFLAEHLSKELGQPFVVENIPGANTTLGSVAALQRPADGYTLLVGTSSGQAANYSLYKTMPYQPSDYAPVACLYRLPPVLAVRKGIPASTVQELAAYAKANPGKLTYGWGSSTTKVGAELFRARTGTEIRGIAYKGAPQIITDMLGGRLDMVVDTPITILPHAQSGELRILAVTSTKRVPSLPDVPTLEESGLSNAVMEPWTGAFVKAGTPPEVVAKLNAAIGKVLASSEYAAFDEKGRTQGFFCSPEELGKHVTAEIEKWRGLIEMSGIEKQ